MLLGVIEHLPIPAPACCLPRYKMHVIAAHKGGGQYCQGNSLLAVNLHNQNQQGFSVGWDRVSLRAGPPPPIFWFSSPARDNPKHLLVRQGLLLGLGTSASDSKGQEGRKVTEVAAPTPRQS